MYQRILTTIGIALLLLVPASTQAQEYPPPNDPGYSEQWALDVIRATCAWDFTRGSTEVTVAVVDSGVDPNHPDLVERLRPDGANFVDNNNDSTDLNGHGTHVAGIIAATIDNAEGITGLAPQVSILPVRVMNERGFGSDVWIASGIRYAADQGAQVINLSLGATLSIGADGESVLVSSAIRYAQDRGALVVAAAGNDFIDLPNVIVGDNPDVLVVAATDQYDRKAPFSNFGDQITVAAPGVRMLSTMPTYEVYLTSDALPLNERMEQNYDYMSGTSQATPLVSALAALIFSANPDWNAQQVAAAIRSTTVDISDRSNRPEQQLLGNGRIDACSPVGLAAVEAGAAPAVPAPPPPAAPRADPGATGGGVLIVLAALGCLGVLLLGFGVFVISRLSRRPTGPRARPAYGPAPQQPPAPVLQPPPHRLQQPSPPHSGAPPAWGTLVIIGGPVLARSYPLAGTTTLIGRSSECAITLLDDDTISRRHTLIRNNGQVVTVEDVNSTHGTYLNNQRISLPTPVRRGDVLRIGQTLLRFD